MRASLLLSIAVMTAPVSSMAQTSMHAGAASAAAGASCVDVSVNDHPALSYACLNQHLAEASGTSGAPTVSLDDVTHEPSNRQLGQFNFSALSIRMGNALGKSATPQRPPPPAPLPLFGAPPPVH
jgi:hypothetical protein